MDGKYKNTIMASPIEEKFIFDELKNITPTVPPQEIFEFGSGENLFPNNVAKLGHNVTAIDLYPRRQETNKNIKFIQDDFINVSFQPNFFDYVYALSSFEHIGLENYNILQLDNVLIKIEKTIEKIKYILKNNGLFLVTLPFGNYKYYYCGNGKWSYNKTSESISGAKVYDIDDIKDIFKKHFEIVKEEYYLKTPEKDFFNLKSWNKTNYKECYVKKEVSHAIVCLKMISNKDKREEQNMNSNIIPKEESKSTPETESITYCMMGFNSLHEIKPYIESVIPYVDRFIYIDGGSTDGTIEYLNDINNDNQNNKIETYIHEWKDNFPEQRNHYLKHFAEKQKEGWLLISDTDEHFTLPTLSELRTLILNMNKEKYDGVKFLAYDIITDDDNPNIVIREHFSKSNFHKPLFFRYNDTLKYVGSAHETLLSNPSIKWKEVNLIYQHIRSQKKIYERAIQNFWVYAMIQKLDKWKEFRNLSMSDNITKFKDFFNLYINGTLPSNIVKWLDEKRNYSLQQPNPNELDLLELRDTTNYYFDLLKKKKQATISTYITTKNSLFFQATLEQTIRQSLLFSNEVVVSLSKLSTDGTLDLLNILKSEYPDKIKIYVDEEHYLKHLEHDQDVLKKRKEYSLKKCTSDYCILQDDDECIHEKYATLIKELPTKYPEALAFRFNTIHFYRSYNHYQNKEGWYPKKIYMVKNIPEIHHGRVGSDPDNHVIIRDNKTEPLDSLSKRFVIDVPITVYHYGWCRNDNVLLMKKYLQEVRWWGREYWKTNEFPFKFDNPIELPEFEDTHPKYMISIIEKQKQLNSMFIKDFEIDFDKSFDKIIESKNKMKISACILTRNEPTRIKGTILHIYPYVDEIIINDGSDTTSTIEEVEKIVDDENKIKISHIPKQTSNFSDERNKMHNQSTSDYLLHIDTDERFNIDFLKNMRNIIEEYLDKNTLPLMFRFPRKNVELDIKKDPDYQIRFLNRQYTRWIRNVHEIPIIIKQDSYSLHNHDMIPANLVYLDKYIINHLSKDRVDIRKRWDIISNKVSDSNDSINRRLLVCSMFKDSSMWMNDVLSCIDNFVKHNNNLSNNNKLLVKLAFLGSKSTDDTIEKLEDYVETSDLKIKYEKFDTESNKKSRYQKLADLRNYLIENSIENIKLDDDDLILFIDSDIKFDKNIIHELIIDMKKSDADIIAPLVCIENNGAFGNNYFYDTLAFRNMNNEQFSHYRPYIFGDIKKSNIKKEKREKIQEALKKIDELNTLRKINWEFNLNTPLNNSFPDKLYNKAFGLIDINIPIEVNSVGSFYLMKHKVIKTTKYSGEHDSEQVEFMNNARSKGYKIFVSQRLKVLHVNLEKYGLKWH